MRDVKNWAVLCTTNDPESLTIVRIARALGIPCIESTQMHGATLSREPNLSERLAELGGVEHLAIVEIPGEKEEEELKGRGIEVHVIDHHTYEGLDRMQNIASLTQFLSLFEITDKDLAEKNIDPEIVQGVALLDQGFVWALAASDLSPEKKRETREYYVACKRSIQPQYVEVEASAESAWERREEREGMVIIRSNGTHHIREAVSFRIADAYPAHPPTSIIIESDGRVSVQETDKAEELFKKFGGFLFGGKRCWGMLGKDNPPSVDNIIANLRA